MDTIKVYAPDSEEYVKLKIACIMLEHLNPDTLYSVQDTYFDFGQRWMWTTIIAHKDGMHWQCLCPRDHERILTAPDIVGTVKDIVQDKWWYNP